MKAAVTAKLGGFKFSDALAAIWATITFGDRYVNERKIWEIKDKAERRRALGNLVSLLEAVAVVLVPFLPDTSKKITEAIAREGDGDAQTAKLTAKKIGILFPRLQ